jgi:antitoxin component YwqK of YwqJK toxin-antitoxin module
MKTYTVIALLTFYSTFSFAQMQTEYYKNGSKKSEGVTIMLNKAKAVSKTDSKQVQREKEKNMIRDGKWTFWFENGAISAEEYYEKGTPTGTWLSFYVNGQQSSSIDFTTGKATYYHDNGQKFEEGTITNTMQREGRWTGWYQNGKLNYEGDYTNGAKTGSWKYYEKNGKLMEEKAQKQPVKTK